MNAQVTPLTDATEVSGDTGHFDHPEDPVGGVSQYPPSGLSEANGAQSDTQVYRVAAMTADENRTQVHDGSTWSSQLLVPDRVVSSSS